MFSRRIQVAAILMAAFAAACAASEPLYDEQADARQEIADAIKTASKSGRPAKNIILDFGANWCFDCHVLEEQMRKPDLAPLIEQNFVVVKVDVGRYDKNLDLAEKYRVPLKKGIPALAVLDSRGKLLYAQDQGEFQDARRLSFESIKAFFEKWKPRR